MDAESFDAKNGTRYEIAIEDSGEEITVWLDGVKKGFISLRRIEGPEDWSPDSYHITHLALEGCRRLGIGRRCLQLHSSMFGSPITAGNGYSGQMDDGSHLTGDGPGFIAKMRQEGLVVDDGRERFGDEEP